jgi:hypothetical protein|tara:strand:- start:59 stop:460 length:402 start_codon:yes stop_codon:yes gene_type:complete
MYEVSNGDLMIFAVLGFCAGLFMSYYLTRLFEIVHMWRVFQETLVRIILMLAFTHENIEFLRELKRKQMDESGFTKKQIQEFEEVDDKTLTNWKNSTIMSLVNTAPPRFRTMMPFVTWEEAMKFANSVLSKKD